MVKADSLILYRDMAAEHDRKSFLVVWKDHQLSEKENVSIEMCRTAVEARQVVRAWLLSEYGSEAVVTATVEVN